MIITKTGALDVNDHKFRNALSSPVTIN